MSTGAHPPPFTLPVCVSVSSWYVSYCQCSDLCQITTSSIHSVLCSYASNAAHPSLDIWPSLSQYRPSILSPYLLYFLCLLSLLLSSPSLPLAAPLRPRSLPDCCIPALPSDREGLVGVRVCVCCVGHVPVILCMCVVVYIDTCPPFLFGVCLHV